MRQNKTTDLIGKALLGTLLGTLVVGASGAHAAPLAQWRFDSAHRQGQTFKALHGPNLATSQPLLTGALGEDALELNRKAVVIAESHTKAKAILPRQNMTVSMRG